MNDEKILVDRLHEINGNLEEIKSLNEVVTNFISELTDTETSQFLKDSAYRTMFLAHIIDEKANFIQSEIEKIIVSMPEKV